MNYTDLSKKQQGAARYGRQQDRYRAKNGKKTRPSDVRPKNFTDGLSGKSKPQTEHVSRFPRKGKALQMNQLELLIAALAPEK